MNVKDVQAGRRYRFQHQTMKHKRKHKRGVITVISVFLGGAFPVRGDVIFDDNKDNIKDGIFMEKEIIGPVDDPVDILKKML